MWRSYRFASLAVHAPFASTSKSWICAPIFTAWLVVSNRVSGPIPHLPAIRLSKKVCALQSDESDVSAEMPVTTTFCGADASDNFAVLWRRDDAGGEIAGA